MSQIKVYKVNDSEIYVETNDGIAYELSDFFSFKAPGYMFHPLFRAKKWDGTIKLFNTFTYKTHMGLWPYMTKFAKLNDYTISIDEKLAPDNIPREEVESFVKSLNLHAGGQKIKLRDYQMEAIYDGINERRKVILSPTASGKSAIIYCILRWILSHSEQDKRKILLLVPTQALTLQMASDFADYASHDDSFDADEVTHIIMGGKEKNANKLCYISTWQSVYKMPKKYFSQFQGILCDEAHEAKAKSLTSIITKGTDCPYKLGFTGTMGSKTINKLVLEGIFGASKKYISTKELMDRGEIAQLNIDAIRLEYSEQERKAAKQFKYPDEIKFVVNSKKRNEFLANLAVLQKENTLLLITQIKHGEKLLELIKKQIEGTNRKVYLINGGTDVELRNAIRAIVEKEKDAIIIASMGTFKRGVNIKNIHHVIFGSPSKSEFAVLQAIGRGLRTSATKTKVKLYDIIDDLSWKRKKNYLLNHFLERLKIYNSEKFEYKMIKIKFH